MHWYISLNTILTKLAVGDTSKKNINTNTESTQYFGIEYFFWESEISIPGDHMMRLSIIHKIYY